MSFIPFGKPSFDEEEIAAVADVLRSGWVTTAARTLEFQKLFAEYTGSQYALALSSCTAGLFLALKCLGVGEGDEVIVPPLTFAATANVVVHCGARPVFADVEAATGLLDPAAFMRAITPKTRAVIPVHLYGLPVSTEISKIAAQHEIPVVGDCAHATETRRDGIHVAKEARIAAFSFYATKNLAVGEGGMIVTDSEELFEKASVLSLHGMSRAAFDRYSEKGFKRYEILEAGYKFNMPDMNAALGIEQLKRIDRHLARRNEIWKRYDEAFKDLRFLRPPAVPKGVVHARHLYTLRTPGSDRDQIIAKLQQDGIGSAVHFGALHLEPFYRNLLGTRRGDFPNAEAISDSTFSIPLTPYLSDEEVGRVIQAVSAL